MPRQFFDPRALRLDPGYVRRRWLLAVGLLTCALPGVVLVLSAASKPFTDGVEWALAIGFTVLGLLPFGAVVRDLRAKLAIVAEPVELHVGITGRKEYAERGRPTGRLTYELSLPELPEAGLRAASRAVTWKIEDRFENEVTTDLAATLWGFGLTQLASYQNEVIRSGGWLEPAGWRRAITELGYTTLEERAYVLAKAGSAQALPRERVRALSRPQRRALRRGRALARAEAHVPPLSRAWPHRRLGYLLRRLLDPGTAGAGNGTGDGDASEPPAPGAYVVRSGRGSFRCPRCTQAMRLPVGKRGTATCPTCRAALPFSS